MNGRHPLNGRHLFWQDWAEYHAICDTCWPKLQREQWCGNTGYSWPRAMKDHIKREAEAWLKEATRCAECGQLLPPVESQKPACEHHWERQKPTGDHSFEVRCTICGLDALEVKGSIYKTLKQFEMGVRDS